MQINLKYFNLGKEYHCKGKILTKKNGFLEGEGYDDKLEETISLKIKFSEDETKSKLLLILDYEFAFLGNKEKEEEYNGIISYMQYPAAAKIIFERRFRAIEEYLKKESGEKAFLKISN